MQKSDYWLDRNEQMLRMSFFVNKCTVPASLGEKSGKNIQPHVCPYMLLLSASLAGLELTLLDL